MDNDNSRPEFRDWVDGQTEPKWKRLPLVHITKAFLAKDIIRLGYIKVSDRGDTETPAAFLFYGRPAYRVSGDGPIKCAAACPFCFIFDPKLLAEAAEIHAFDTGAFRKRMYSHVLLDEMNVDDFSLEQVLVRPNKLIAAIYGSLLRYFDGDLSHAPHPDRVAGQSEFLARAYLDLIHSTGRNEPDDRVGTIEAKFTDHIALQSVAQGGLLAVVVPDILWSGDTKTTWLRELSEFGIDILPFRFSIGREPGHHHALIEQEVRRYYTDREFL